MNADWLCNSKTNHKHFRLDSDKVNVKILDFSCLARLQFCFCYLFFDLFFGHLYWSETSTGRWRAAKKHGPHNARLGFKLWPLKRSSASNPKSTQCFLFTGKFAFSVNVCRRLGLRGEGRYHTAVSSSYTETLLWATVNCQQIITHVYNCHKGSWHTKSRCALSFFSARRYRQKIVPLCHCKRRGLKIISIYPFIISNRDGLSFMATLALLCWRKGDHPQTGQL